MTTTTTPELAHGARDTRGREAAATLPAFAHGPVFACSGSFLAVQLAVAARYGLHRDELYFLACGRHLAWGYVDQPPFVPFVAREVDALFGASAVSLRVLPALAGATVVVLAALIAASSVAGVEPRRSRRSALR